MKKLILGITIMVVGQVALAADGSEKLKKSLLGYRNSKIKAMQKKVGKSHQKPDLILKKINYNDYLELVTEILETLEQEKQYDETEFQSTAQALLNYKIKKLVDSFKLDGNQNIVIIDALFLKFVASRGGDYDYSFMVNCKLDFKIGIINDFLEILVDEMRDPSAMDMEDYVLLADEEPSESELDKWKNKLSDADYDIEQVLNWVDEIDVTSVPPIEVIDYLLIMLAGETVETLKIMTLKEKEHALWDGFAKFLYYKVKKLTEGSYEEFLEDISIHSNAAQRLAIQALLNVGQDWQNVVLIEYLIHYLAAGRVGYDKLIMMPLDHKISHLKSWILNSHYDLSL